ncbi:MAG: glycosyltransferase [Candidatus Eremiobacteraeota bacterium]|nr:glycosyltransferase [Candidatus Eremiobacteraeota bacterium]
MNRRLVGALLDRGNLEIATEPESVGTAELPEEFRRFATTPAFGPADADVTVVHRWPPSFERPARGRYVHVQPWEYGSMPVAWFEPLRERADDVWTHSTFNRDCYAEAGIPPERVAVVPHGIDPAIFTPEGPQADDRGTRFRFLYVGGTIPRKGIDVLVNAYARAFKRSDDVVLTIKDLGGADYRGQNFAEQLRGLAQRPDIAAIEYTDQILPDRSLASLMRASDVLVLSYRGEGFGLPVVEAMACGVPVIVTAGGATDDFVDDSVGWRIPSRRTVLEPAQSPLPTVTPAWLLEPNLDELVVLLRDAYRDRDEVRRRGAAADARARTWPWDRSASIAEARMAEIAQRTGSR